MKGKLVITIGAFASVMGVSAQTQYDAARLMGSDLNGTARFVGMGGAMGALGGDISVMGTNPAGIGIYRSNDVAASFGFNNTSAKSDFRNSVMKEDKTRMSFDNIGFVYSNKIGNNTTLRYVNFGFNYHKSKNFNKVFAMGGPLDGFSQTRQIANMAYGMYPKTYEELLDANINPYTNPQYNDVDYLTIMGAWCDLIAPQYGEDGKPIVNGEGGGEYVGWQGLGNYYYSRESGGVSQYDFNIAFNIEDRVYLGLTLGAYDVNYTRYSYYEEDLDDGNGTGTSVGLYSLENWFNTEGAGVDFKLGAIVRPFENSPFRLGLAVHTPTWYNLTDSYSAYMVSDIDNKHYEQDTYRELGDRDYVYDYQIVTPWKFNVSMGTTFSGLVAVGAEYEYEDYSTAKIKDTDGRTLSGTDLIKEDLKGVHTLRLGMETRIVPQVSVRAGYNYTSAVFRKGAFKSFYRGDTRTDTEYNNVMQKNVFTVGLGYRGSIIYADLAYKYDTYKSDFYAFDGSNQFQEHMVPTKVDNNRHQLLFTIGARF